MAQTIDIKEIVKAVVDNGGQVTNDVRVLNVSIYPAQADNVDYWATISISSPIIGMIAEGSGDAVTYRKGVTKTVTVPVGTLFTLLSEALLASDTDEAFDLLSYKSILYSDMEKEALSGGTKPYISHLHKMLIGSKVSVLARPVAKGKVKSLFSLNEREVTVERDSVWHDLYGLNAIRPKTIAAALAACETANEANATDEAEAKANAFDALLAKYRGSNNVDAAFA